MQTLLKVRKFIQEKKLANNNTRILVGVSGGADSMALLHILNKLGYECTAVHCNFHLRGGESDRDFYFVKTFCSENNINFESADFDTFQYMKDNSLSLEMAARELRYDWFEKIRNKIKAEKIAIAHHKDDSVETVLINLIRGTGIRGLTGIPVSNGQIIRPLLCLYRDEILDYLKINNLNFVEDSTNNENIYLRNKIRLDIIPQLKSLNPSVIQSISRTSENLLPVESIYNSFIDKAAQHVFFDNRINIDLLLNEELPETILFEILYKYEFTPDTIRNIYASAFEQSGKIFYSEQYRLIKDRKYFIIEKLNIKDKQVYFINEQDDSIENPITINIERIKYDPDFVLEKNKSIIYIDQDKVVYPLTIRRWKQGDKFIPFGMKGCKKISDYFSDKKFSISDKENTWLLCSSDKIIWIIGERADNRFRITDKTKQIIKISI